MTARVLVVAAHPDDETIGAGALLARSVDSYVIVVTNGVPRDRSAWPADVEAQPEDAYAAIRREELRRALAEAGIGDDRVHLLDVTDGEAVDSIAVIVGRLIELFERIVPDIVLTHAYEGGHVDHDATALAVHAAMALSGGGRPYEMALYHGGRGSVTTHDFLSDAEPARCLQLDNRLRAVKGRMLSCFHSQRKYSDYFATDVERYRCAPAYDFLRSPDEGQPLLYERATGVTYDDWLERARTQVATLGLGDWLNTARDRVVSPKPSLTISENSGAPGPLVSVIVRTVGRETLAAALESIACQTHRNIEIVLVDVTGDAMPAAWRDRPGLVLRVCAAPGFDRPQAANAGMAEARGDYIAFLDDDDWMHPEHVAVLLDTIRRADTEAAYSAVEVVEWRDGAAPRRRFVYDSPYDPIALLCENYIPLNALLFDRRLRDEGCRFDEGLSLLEDWDFLIRLSRRTDFAMTRRVTAVYRWPPGSGVTDPNRTGPSQARIFGQWRSALSDEQYVELMRRAAEQSALNHDRAAELRALRAHLQAQDEELARLRPWVTAHHDEQQRLVDHLRHLDAELDRLRAHLTGLETEKHTLQEHLRSQDAELDRLRPYLTALETEKRTLQEHLRSQDAELERVRRQIDELRRAEESLREHGIHLENANSEVAQRGDQIRRLVQTLGVREAELEAIRAEAAEAHRLRVQVVALQEQVADLLASSSWRLTAPLRAVYRLLVGARGRTHGQ